MEILSILRNCAERVLRLNTLVVLFLFLCISFFHIFWVIVWLLKSEQIWTEMRDVFFYVEHSAAQRAPVFASASQKNPKATNTPDSWSLKDCASLLCLHFCIVYVLPLSLCLSNEAKQGWHNEERRVKANLWFCGITVFVGFYLCSQMWWGFLSAHVPLLKAPGVTLLMSPLYFLSSSCAWPRCT